MNDTCRRRRKTSSLLELSMDTNSLLSAECQQRDTNNKHHLYLICPTATTTTTATTVLIKSENAHCKLKTTIPTNTYRASNQYSKKTMPLQCCYVITTLILPLLLLTLLLNISVITSQNIEAPRPPKSFIAPSLPQFVPSSHVSYQDGRRSNGQASNQQDEESKSSHVGGSEAAQILSYASQQQLNNNNNNDDAFRFKRTPLVSSPVSSLLPPTIMTSDAVSINNNNNNDQQYHGSDNNYNLNHHRYGLHGQESLVASPPVSMESGAGAGTGDLLMSSSSILTDQLNNQQYDHAQQPTIRHHQTLQHRSSSTFEMATLGRSARQNYVHISSGSNNNNGKQQQADDELESERLRQRQHIQYHDQWPSMAGKCHKRTLNFCARVLPFNTTIFPNIIGDTNRFEVKRSLPFFGFLAKSNCNKRLDQLLCMLLEPPCHTETSKAIPPCKKFCRVALEGCGEYIPATLAMSSVFDCRKYPDSNDPNVCVNLARGNTCAEDEFKCPDKTCIPRHWVCDGVRDCIFAADEANCTAPSNNQEAQSVCSTEEFKCDGKCVPKSWKCDRERDCLDGSDEESCDAKPQCGPDRFRCADGNGCIPKRWVCDGKAECRDGSDEQQCSQKECSENDFKCDNGICIPKIWRCDQQMDCKDGSDEFNCVYPTTVSTTTIVNSTQPSSTTTTTTIMPTMAVSSLVNETLLLPNVEALISDAAVETYGVYETPLPNNNDRSDSLTSSSIVKHYLPAGVAGAVEQSSDNTPIESHNQNYTTGLFATRELEDINRLLGMQQQQQQQLSTSSVAPVAELMTSSSAVSSINSGSGGANGNGRISKGDPASTGDARDEENSSQQNIAKTVSNDAKTSYLVDDTKQLSDIQINALQPQDKAQLSQPNHQQIVSLPREQQTQKQLASISTKHNNQEIHHQPQVTSSYAPSIIINNNKIKQQANEVAAPVDSLSSAQQQQSTPSMLNSKNLPDADNLAHDDNNQQQSLYSMNNHRQAHQQRLQFQQQHQLQQQQQQSFPTSQHMHLQQARRLFSSFNKYTGQTQQSRAPKLHHNKVPIYRSWINSLTGNHFHSQQNPLTNSNIQATLDNVTPYRQKRDRLMAATQMPASTVSAIQVLSTSVSPSLQPSSVSLSAGGSSPATSSTPSIPPFSTQGPRGAGSYFQLLSRYNLAGHRSPKAIPLIDYHQPQSQSLGSQRNRLVKPSGEYFQRNGLTGETLIN